MRLFLVVTVLSLTLTGCAGPDGSDAPSGTSPTASPSTSPGGPADAPSRLDRFFDFEDGLGNWSRDADVPDDPNRPGEPVDWNITRTNETGYEDHVHVVGHPVHSVRFCLDGRQDDGTIWLEQTLPLAPGTYDVEAELQAWSRSESFNTLAYVVLRVGSGDAEREEDFPPPHHNGATSASAGGLREVLDQQAGWKRYNTSFKVETDGGLQVAFGISAVWETEMCYDLDAVRVQATAA